MAGELDALMAQFQLSDEERRRLLLGNALLGLGAGLAGGKPGDWIGSAAGGLAAGAGMGQRAVSNAREDKAAEFKMREYAEGKAAARAQAERAAAANAEIGALFSNPTAGMGDRSPTTSNAAAVPQKWELYMQAAQKAALAGNIEAAKQYAAMAEKFKPKYSQTPQIGMDENGRPYQFILDESGNEKRLAAGAKPDFAEIDLGGTKQFVNRYDIPASGQTFAKTLTPGDVQQGQQWAADYGLRKNADARAAASAAQAQAPAWANDLDRGIQIDPRTGQARPIMAGGQPVGAKGASKQAEQSKTALTIIGEAEKLIGGATGSYLGAAADQATRVFGAATSGDEAIAQLQALEGALMLNQPRMEGPQSDRDTALYKQMAGRIGDPTVPNSMKKAALTTIKSLHKKYAAGVSFGGASGGWSAEEIR